MAKCKNQKCGKEFTPHKAAYYQTQIYCSRACAVKRTGWGKFHYLKVTKALGGY